MPLYDYQCEACSHEFEAFNSMANRRRQRCEKCDGRAVIVIRAAAVHLFQPDWYEDITHKPLWIETKRQLREECKKHGVEAVALM